MHVRTILLLCLCLNEQFEIGRLSDNAQSDNDLLSRLLDLHVQHCGNDVMCHDTNVTRVESPSTFPQPCCIPCSCLSTCGAEQTCCPSVNNSVPPQDIQSSNAEKPKEDNAFVTTNNSQNDYEHGWSQPYRNDTEAREAILRPPSHSGEASTLYGMENEHNTVTPKIFGTALAESSDSKLNNYYNFKTDCVRPQLFYKPNFHPDSDAYEMIVSCPLGFGDSQVAEKCRNGEEKENIADIVPVTSTSGFTYINKYCLFCNEQKSTWQGDAWDIQIIDENFVYLHKVYDHPQSLWATNREPFFNIHFVPKNTKSVKKCKLYDVVTCNQTGYWETYDEIIYTVCHNGSELPVISDVNRIPYLFKNIACVHCNSPPDSQNRQPLRCGYYERPKIHARKTLAVNFNALAEYQNLERTNFDDTYMGDSVPQNIDFGSCPPGLAVILGRCRKLLCPRDHYVDMGSCVPLYTMVTGLGFKFRIKATPLQDIRGGKIQQVAETLLSVVNDKLVRSIALKNRNITLSYLARDNGKVVRYYLLDIKIYNAKREFLYSQAVQEVYNFFEEIKTTDALRLSTGVGLGFKYDIGHGIEESRRGLVDLVNPGDGKFRALIKDEPSVQGPKSYLTLTDINWCVRTELLPSDVETLAPLVFKVKLTGKLLFQDQFDLVDLEFQGYIRNFRLSTCASYFVDDTVKEIKPQQTVPSMVQESANIQNDEQASEHDKGIAIFSVVIVIAVICIVVFKVRSYARKQQLRAAAQTQGGGGGVPGGNISSFCDSSNESAVPTVSVVIIKLGSMSTKGRDNSEKITDNNEIE